jgi:hypothetical protein
LPGVSACLLRAMGATIVGTTGNPSPLDVPLEFMSHVF